MFWKGLFTSVPAEPRNRKNWVLPKPWSGPLSLPESSKFLSSSMYIWKISIFEGVDVSSPYDENVQSRITIATNHPVCFPVHQEMGNDFVWQ